MKANELRIGNLVIIRNTYTGKEKENEVDIYDLRYLSGEFSTKFEIKPIPLTEQWLLDFGFEEETFGLKHQNLDLYFYFDKDFLESDQLPMFIFLQHVHQLQNLYFALTGEELTRKPCTTK